MLGRDRECALLDGLVGGIRNGRSAVLVITGEPGVGKTSMLQYASVRAKDALVVRTTGIEGESAIPYAHLADALRPIHAEIATLPQRQAAALSSAFAIGPSMPADRFVISVAVLNLLSGLAVGRPVLVLVDDLQWVDRGSREVLTFVSHRLEAESIGVLFAVRHGLQADLKLDRFRTLALEGLDEVSCRRLVEQARGPRSPGEVDALVDGSGGNPLALLELAQPVSPSRSSGRAQRWEPLPLTKVLEQAFVATSRSLSAPAQAGLALLSVIGSAPEEVLRRALDAVGLEPGVLVEAEQAGLVRAERNKFAFTHPLVRSAVYQCVAPHQRRANHRAAAGALAASDVPGAAERRAWHLLESGLTTNAALADELEATGRTQLATANFAAAALAFHRGALLSPRGEGHVARLTMAAHCARLSGEVDDCRDLIQEALRVGTDPAAVRQLRYLLCRLDLWAGDKRQSRDRLLELVQGPSHASVAPGQDAYMAADIALASVETGELSLADTWSRRAEALAVEQCGAVPLAVLTVRALVRGLLDDPGATTELNFRRDEVATFDPLATDLDEQVVLLAGLAHLAAEDVESAGVILQRSVDAARSRSALGMLPFRLGRLAVAETWVGSLARASAHANESLALAADTGWEGERLNSLVVCARVEALSGQDARCREHAAQAIELATSASTLSYLAGAHAALGLLCLSRSEVEAAVDYYQRVEAFAQERGMVDTPLLWWTGDLVESLVAADRTDEAARLLAARRVQDGPGRPILAAVLARCAALVDRTRTEDHLAEAMRWHRRSAAPFERARTEHLLGSWLRRRRDPRSRETLASALSTFERLGATAWAERTRDELRAAGVRVARPESALADLTPQELQVAVVVGQGHSNREVAAQLFLSVKTVEYHLNKAFLKLGLSRRGQLAALLAQQGASANPTRGPN